MAKNSNVSLNYIKRIKKIMINVVVENNQKNKIKPGDDPPVQVPESIIVKNKLHNSPFEKYDKIKEGT